MKIKTSARWIALVAIIVLAITWSVIKNYKKTTPDTSRIAKKNRPCPGPEIKVEVPDVYMRGRLDKGTVVKVLTHHYDCNPLNRGDLVYFRISDSIDPVIRIAVGIPGDRFRLIKDKALKRWNLEINGEIVKMNQQNYAFGGDTPPTLHLYLREGEGRLKDDEMILFSAFPPGERDSGTLGVLSLEDAIGKVVVP